MERPGSLGWLDDQILKSTVMLEHVSTRHGLGAVSTAHTDEHLEKTFAAFEAALERFRRAGLL